MFVADHSSLHSFHPRAFSRSRPPCSSCSDAASASRRFTFYLCSRPRCRVKYASRLLQEFFAPPRLSGGARNSCSTRDALTTHHVNSFLLLQPKYVRQLLKSSAADSQHRKIQLLTSFSLFSHLPELVLKHPHTLTSRESCCLA